jgi:hypothetical protein
MKSKSEYIFSHLHNYTHYMATLYVSLFALLFLILKKIANSGGVKQSELQTRAE